MNHILAHPTPPFIGQVCNNLCLAISMVAVSESMILGSKMGLDPKARLESCTLHPSVTASATQPGSPERGPRSRSQALVASERRITALSYRRMTVSPYRRMTVSPYHDTARATPPSQRASFPLGLEGIWCSYARYARCRFSSTVAEAWAFGRGEAVVSRVMKEGPPQGRRLPRGLPPCWGDSGSCIRWRRTFYEDPPSSTFPGCFFRGSDP